MVFAWIYAAAKHRLAALSAAAQAPLS
jgi:hypothetical protein